MKNTALDSIFFRYSLLLLALRRQWTSLALSNWTNWIRIPSKLCKCTIIKTSNRRLHIQPKMSSSSSSNNNTMLPTMLFSDDSSSNILWISGNKINRSFHFLLGRAYHRSQGKTMRILWSQVANTAAQARSLAVTTGCPQSRKRNQHPFSKRHLCQARRASGVHGLWVICDEKRVYFLHPLPLRKPAARDFLEGDHLLLLLLLLLLPSLMLTPCQEVIRPPLLRRSNTRRRWHRRHPRLRLRYLTSQPVAICTIARQLLHPRCMTKDTPHHLPLLRKGPRIFDHVLFPPCIIHAKCLMIDALSCKLSFADVLFFTLFIIKSFHQYNLESKPKKRAASYLTWSLEIGHIGIDSDWRLGPQVPH